MKIRAIIVDLDRTLLRSDKTISPYTVEVLEKCRNSGLKIMVATARPLRTIEEFRRMIEFDALTVSNGARIVRGEQCRECGIAPESAKRLLKALEKKPELPVTLETGECAYSNKPVADYETVISADLAATAETEGSLKILVHVDDAETVERIKGELTEDLYCTLAHGYLLQIMSKNATKWNGVKAMLEMEGCSPEEAAYFGDDNDDVEPIAMCGIGVAVANGIDEAKAAADYIAESNDADGVAKFIEKHLV